MPPDPVSSRTIKVAPLRCEFCDITTENDFLQHQLRMTQGQLRVTFLFCALFYLCFALTDLIWLGYELKTCLLVGARVAVAATVLTCLALLKRRPDSIPFTRVAANIVEVAGAAGFLLIAALRPTEFSLHAISMSIVIIVLYIYIPNRLIYAAAIAAGATVVFICLAWRLGDVGGIELPTMAALLALTNLFGYVAARRYQILWREEYSAQMVLKNLSVRDPLTGCYNRRHLHEQLLETEISRAQRYRLSLTVIMCDLDHFKAVNDTYGHHGGDVVLQRFAALLQSMTRDNIDSVVRYGGEEFLLILPETDLAGGQLLAERLRQTLATTPVEHAGQRITVTASFGVASVDFASPARTAHINMIAAADDLLYAAKNSGRNRVCAQQLV
ncbi:MULTISPECIES: GGDEF domain-containing protein [unclassified Duganella]|jgi:diguanylate cyclase (GGDEF)-like protein|uniref:GGDEF domain-containing protein n=1 Tax=unclassified Duganella TaxID=2636909 RepID=UPI00088748D5|nr:MULTISPECIES: GGDEF domain-containing protein [unclassified Duganella]SDG40154.1 diguanylate cyclase (GGDEF) domain-containing protein [Duganella sp. OV458]SDJ63729.1 diguanylate cyclase (GGDEF) domain-containing protein [Duganella sp. OV510]